MFLKHQSFSTVICQDTNTFFSKYQIDVSSLLQILAKTCCDVLSYRNFVELFQVFLQHLNLLLSLPTFTALWLTILDFMDKYMHSDESDLLVKFIIRYLCSTAPLGKGRDNLNHFSVHSFSLCFIVRSDSRVTKEHALSDVNRWHIPRRRSRAQRYRSPALHRALASDLGTNRLFLTKSETRAFREQTAAFTPRRNRESSTGKKAVD